MADSTLEELDELTLNFFEKFETLQRKRNNLCKVMKDGYLNLSQARYSMGNKAVGAMQYSSRMQALISVHENDAMKFELKKNVLNESTEKEEDPEEKPSTSGLRKRNVLASSKENGGNLKQDVNDKLVVGVQEIELNDMVKRNKNQVQDPLKWFGVLVPMCLRTGQNDFKTAVDVCCELVNLENELKDLMKNYRELKTLKRKQRSLIRKNGGIEEDK